MQRGQTSYDMFLYVTFFFCASRCASWSWSSASCKCDADLILRKNKKNSTWNSVKTPASPRWGHLAGKKKRKICRDSELYVLKCSCEGGRMSTGRKKRHFLLPAVNVEHDKSHLKRNVEEKGYIGCVFFIIFSGYPSGSCRLWLFQHWDTVWSSTSLALRVV